MIPIYKPFLNKYKSSAIEAINDEWISNHGIYIDLATQKIKDILGIKYCILMNNGTSATHCLFKALKFKYPNIKKLYVPNCVFISPINCAISEYDSNCIEIMKTNENTLNIDTSDDYINALEYNSAVLIVHNLGSIVNVPRLKRLRPDLIFIEDNCEALFGKYENKYTGSDESSLCSAVSFYGNKTITTGEGGAFFTNDLEVYKYIKTYHSHGMSEVRYIHNVLGTNYRMTNVQAGFLYDQLKDINTILTLKRNIFDNYQTLLKNLHDSKAISYIDTEKNTEKSNWMFALIIHNINYSSFENFMNEKQIQIRPLFYDLHCHLHLKDLKKHEDQEFTKTITNKGVMLPSYPELSLNQQTYIVESIKEYLTIHSV
jgi:perosamine synthetase